jgi:hypothetical protein
MWNETCNNYQIKSISAIRLVYFLCIVVLMAKYQQQDADSEDLGCIAVYLTADLLLQISLSFPLS